MTARKLQKPPAPDNARIPSKKSELDTRARRTVCPAPLRQQPFPRTRATLAQGTPLGLRKILHRGGAAPGFRRNWGDGSPPKTNTYQPINHLPINHIATTQFIPSQSLLSSLSHPSLAASSLPVPCPLACLPCRACPCRACPPIPSPLSYLPVRPPLALSAPSLPHCPTRPCRRP